MLGLNNMQDKSCYWRTMQDMLKDPQDHKKSGFDRDCGCSLLKDYSGSEAHDLRDRSPRASLNPLQCNRSNGRKQIIR